VASQGRSAYPATCCSRVFGRPVVVTKIANNSVIGAASYVPVPMAVADDALVAVRGLQIGMLAQKVCNLGLYRLGEQGTRPMAQDFARRFLAESAL
jgi:hypothetical protein